MIEEKIDEKNKPTAPTGQARKETSRVSTEKRLT